MEPVKQMLNHTRNSVNVPEIQSEDGLRILVSDPVDEILVDGLRKHGHHVDYLPSLSTEALGEKLEHYEVIVVRSRTKLHGDLLRRAKNLKFIARAGIGTDNIDLKAAESMGIRVITAAGSSTQSVVELNIGLLINLARRIVRLNTELRKGIYRKETGTELAGKTAGIIGFGRIGQATSRALKALGMSITAFDIFENKGAMEEIGGVFLPLEELLRNSDYVFVLLTLGKESEKILGEREMGLMKSGAMIINTSRAEAVDPDALFRLLKNGKLGGYGSDVLWHEPPESEIEKEILSMENVIITPHIGAQTHEAQKRVASVTLDNLLQAIEEVK